VPGKRAFMHPDESVGSNKLTSLSFCGLITPTYT
jgi:hypothetical protein